MIRKLTFAFVAAAALGTAALAPTAASAHWVGGGWGGGYHGGWYGGLGWTPRVFIGGPDYYASCSVQRWVSTPWGPRLRWVNVC